MRKNAVTNQKIKYTIDKKSFFGHSAVLLMGLSAIFRIIGCWDMWTDTLLLVMHIAIPVVSCILLILCVSFLGKKGFFLSCVPVILGVIFFIYKAFSFESRIHMVLCILLYLAVAILYTGTVTGSIHTKWLLPPLFGLPFIYHIVVEDLPALNNTAAVPVTFADGMQEMSVLCIMAALFCIGMGLKKQVISTETTIVAEPAMPEPPVDVVPGTEDAVDAEPAETAAACAVVDGVMQCEGEPVEIPVAEVPAAEELPAEPVAEISVEPADEK